MSAGGLQVGQLIAFINYLMQTLMSLMMVSMLVVRVSRGRGVGASASRRCWTASHELPDAAGRA